MSDDLDLRAIHRRHEPDPRFVAALGDRLEAILANSASADVSTDEAARSRSNWNPGTRSVPRRDAAAGGCLVPRSSWPRPVWWSSPWWSPWTPPRTTT